MKLTNQHRTDFLDAVMKGIPRATPVWNAEDARGRLRKLFEEQLPEEVRTLMVKYPRLIQRHTDYSVSGLDYSVIRTNGELYVTRFKFASVHWETHLELKGVAEEQARKLASDREDDARKDIRNRLAEIVASCTTLAKLKMALPELESYMPVEILKRNLPVASGSIVSDLLVAGIKIPKPE